MGPLWDFDWAFTGWGTHIFFGDHTGWIGKHAFFLRFFEDPVFLTKYKERWNEKYAEITNISNFITECGAKLEAAVLEDTKRWKIEGGYMSDYPTDYLGEIAKMKTWWNNRVAWLNKEIRNLSVPVVPSENPLKAWVSNGQVHVTGLTEGKVWSIHNVIGQTIHRSSATGEKATVKLPSQGVYIVQCEGNAIKVVF